jgi:RNA polymerase sigma-70 factor (ECF subfamily)
MNEPRTASERVQRPSGEDPEFQDLFLRYHHSALRFFLAKGFSEDEAIDLTQETFFQAYRSWRRFRAESGIPTWLFSIARRVAVNEIRNRTALKREGSEVSIEVLEAPAAEGLAGERGADPLEDVLHAERMNVLREAMESLPPQMRRCVLLRLDRDLKYREIADVMQISIDTVKAHLFQARQQLKEKLSAYFADIDF